MATSPIELSWPKLKPGQSGGAGCGCFPLSGARKMAQRMHVQSTLNLCDYAPGVNTQKSPATVMQKQSGAIVAFCEGSTCLFVCQPCKPTISLPPTFPAPNEIGMYSRGYSRGVLPPPPLLCHREGAVRMSHARRHGARCYVSPMRTPIMVTLYIASKWALGTEHNSWLVLIACICETLF